MTIKRIVNCPYCGKTISKQRSKTGIAFFRAWGFVKDFRGHGRGKGEIITLGRIYPTKQNFIKYAFMKNLKVKLIWILRELYRTECITFQDIMSADMRRLAYKAKTEFEDLMKPKEVNTYPNIKVKKYRSTITDLEKVFKPKPIIVEHYESIETEEW